MISLIITVFNERKTLPLWLKSINAQTLQPGEIVIVDGGSTDGTAEWLRAQVEQQQNLRVFVHPSNIAAGRNYAISNSIGDTIVVTDAGCTYAPNWFEKITAPLRELKAETAATAFGPWFETGDRALVYAVAAATTPAPAEFKRDWLPSSRSVAFHKDLWHTVGGYPEWIPFCEDVIFDLKLAAKARFNYIREPLVFWRPRLSIWLYCKQLFNYTRSEAHGKLNLYRHIIRFGAYTVALILVLLAAEYNAWAIALLVCGASVYSAKFYARLAVFTAEQTFFKQTKAKLFLPFIIGVGDVAKMCGWLYGIIERVSGTVRYQK